MVNLLNGIIPVILKLTVILSTFIAPAQAELSSWQNFCFGDDFLLLDCVYFLYSSCQQPFKAVKRAQSSGCIMWVVLGGKQKMMKLSSCLITAGLKWDN